MTDQLRYPRNTIWFIRAEEDTKENSEGSAVAIRLKRKGANGPPQVYLLTCAHVIRKRERDKEFGSTYATIRAWQPSWGFSATDMTSGAAVSVVRNIFPTETNTCMFYESKVLLMGHADWVLLQFADKAICEDLSLPTITEWSAPEAGHSCHIYGYPGGSRDFSPPKRIVSPSVPFASVPLKGVEGGLLTFQGLNTRAGMSGAGVFDATTNELVGLHRSRDDLTLNLRAVSIYQIRTILEKDYTLAHFDPRQDEGLDVTDRYCQALIAKQSIIATFFNDVFVPLYCQTAPPLQQLDRTAQREEAVKVILAAAAPGTGTSRLAILGQFGTGKSCLLQQAAKLIAQQFVDHSQVACPVLVQLRNYDSSKPLSEHVSNAIANLVTTQPEPIADALRTRRFIFLFDGLDELPGVPTLEGLRTILRQIEDLTATGVGSHAVVLTSRTTYFHTQLQEGRLRAFQRWYLCDWEEKQWNACIETLTLKPEERTSLSRFSGPLASKPFYATLILSHRQRVMEAGDNLTPSSLYDFYISDTLQHQALRHDGPLDELQKREAMRQVALTMFFESSTEVDIRTLESIATDLAGSSDDVAPFTHDLINATLLERTSRDTYQFTHQSVMEYLVADTLADAIIAHDISLLSVRYLYLEVWGFMVPMMSERHIDAMFEMLASSSNRFLNANLLVLLRRTAAIHPYPEPHRLNAVIQARLCDLSDAAIQARYVAAFSAWRCVYTSEFVTCLVDTYHAEQSMIVKRILWYTIRYFCDEYAADVELPDSQPPGDCYEPDFAKRAFAEDESAIQAFLIVDSGNVAQENGPFWIVKVGTTLLLASHGELRAVPDFLHLLIVGNSALVDTSLCCLRSLAAYYQEQPEALAVAIDESLDDVPDEDRRRIEQILLLQGFID